MTDPTDSSVSTKVLSIDHTLLVFFFIFFLFFTDNCNYGSLFRKDIKIKDFLLFTIIYSISNSSNLLNVVKTISPWQEAAKSKSL